MNAAAVRRLRGFAARRSVVALVLIAVIAAVLLALVGWRYRTLSRENEALTNARAYERASALANLLSETMGSVLAEADALHRMAALATDAKQSGRAYSAGQLMSFLDARAGAYWPDVVQISATGPDGRLLWSTLSDSAAGTDISDHEHIRALLDHPDRGSFISRPVLGKVSHVWSVQSAHAVREADGALRAITVVSLRADALRRLCQTLSLDSRDAVSMARSDGVVLMRNDMRYIGSQLSNTPNLSAFAHDGTTTFSGPSQLDGEDRIVALRPLNGFPLAIYVGLSRAHLREGMEAIQAPLLHATLFAEAAILAVAIGGVVLLLALRRSALAAARASALAESQKWFQVVTDHMTDGALVCDGISRGDFRISFASRRAGEILGVPSSELTGTELHRFFNPEDQERGRIERQAITAGTAMFSSRYVITRPDGAKLHVVLSSMSAPKPEKPAELRAVTLLRDVTEQEQREAALAEARAQIDHMLQVVPGVFYRSVREPGQNHYRALFLSGGIGEMFGVDLLTASQPGFLSGVTGQNLTALRETALANAGPEQIGLFEYPVTWRGRRMWLRDTLRAVPRDDGVHEIVGFISDNTAQREAEETLNTAILLGPGVLYRARVTESRVEVLNAYGDASRISDRRAPGQPVSAANLSERLTELGHAAAMFQVSESAPAMLDQVVTRQGNSRWLRNAVRVIGRGEGYVEVAGYIIDVTREKTEQMRMQQVTTLLTLGEMATGMAHELTQPLASISFAAQNAAYLMEGDQVSKAALASKIEKIEREAARADKLVQHMRIFARNERVAPGAIRWSEALEGAREILQVRLRGCSLVESLPADLPPVMGAAIPMEQVLINLIGNAIDAYADAPANTARIVKVSGAQDGDFIVLTVADRAGGIPPAVMGRIFEPFFTTKPVGKGTGLGLALVFGTVSDMGGTVAVRNENGGAVFEIRLPRAHEEPMEAEAHEHAPAGEHAV